MKILHTSDWHLGLKLSKFDLNDQMSAFIEWLIKWIEREQIDCIIHAGDIFDNKYPSLDAIHLYNHFLNRIVKLGCQVIVVAGNHDSASFLESPRHLVKTLDVHIIGHHRIGDEEIVVVKDRAGQDAVVVCAIPYIKEGALVTFTPSMSREGYAKVVTESMADKYLESYEFARNKFPSLPIIATGHLFVQGMEASDAEHQIHVGTLGGITASVVNCGFDYVALGHIHRGQSVTADNKVRYSGSPVTLSFSEYQDVKHMVLLEINNGRLQTTKIEVPVFRSFLRWKGNVEELIHRLESHTRQGALPDMIELTLKEDKNIGSEAVALNDFLIQGPLDKPYFIARRIHERVLDPNDGDQLGIVEEISDLKPTMIFQKILDYNKYDDEQTQMLLDEFIRIEKTIYEN